MKQHWKYWINSPHFATFSFSAAEPEPVKRERLRLRLKANYFLNTSYKKYLIFMTLIFLGSKNIMVLKKKLFWINLLLLFDHKPAPIIFLPRSQLISTHTWQRPCWGCHSRGQTVPPAVRMSGSSGPAYRLWRLNKRGPGIRGSNTKTTHPIYLHPVTSEYNRDQ